MDVQDKVDYIKSRNRSADDDLPIDDIELELLSDKGYGSDDDYKEDSGSQRIQPAYTAKQEKAVIRKLDKNLITFLALLYMLSFLDRSNIGNAKIAGMTDDLNLTSNQYQWVLTAFYITYVSFEWMTLLYRVIPPHIYISICVASWGLVASLQCLARSFTSLLILRALLGITEAAFGPGVPFYLSFFYNREELALRIGLFISAAPLATSFASSLAWVIVKLGTFTPIASWRLLFLVEGFPSVIVAYIAWWYIPDSPATARFLHYKEKKIAWERLKNKHSPSTTKPKAQIQWKEIIQTLIDPKSFILAIMFFNLNVSFSSLPPFLPTIIKDMQFSPLKSQALSAPPYLFAFVTVILTTWASDRMQNRSLFLLFHSFFGALGYLWLALSGYLGWSSISRYVGTFPAAAGFFSAVALTITWAIDNRRSAEGKGTGVALLNIVGQLGPLVGTRLYPKDDAPYYVRGMSTCAALMFAVGGLTYLLAFMLSQENERIAVGMIYEISEQGREAETQDASPKGNALQRQTLNIL